MAWCNRCKSFHSDPVDRGCRKPRADEVRGLAKDITGRSVHPRKRRQR